MDGQACAPLLAPFFGDVLERLDERQREALFERAAILEFDANCRPRALAEALAALDLLRRQPHVLTGLAAIQIERDGTTRWVLTGSVGFALRHLTEAGARVISVLDPRGVVRRQYGDVALLGALD